MHLNSHYAVGPGTMFRREDFGGIVYQRAGDRLHFIKSRLAMEGPVSRQCGSIS
jgi:putative mycofactocin binding protein MftB